MSILHRLALATHQTTPESNAEMRLDFPLNPVHNDSKRFALGSEET